MQQSSSSLMGIVQDMRYAARLLCRHARFTVLATLTMALGIAAMTVLFGVTYGVLVKPLPWVSGDRLVVLKETRGGSAPRFGSMTNTAYLAWREAASTLEGLGAWSQRTVTMTGRGDPDRIRITQASASMFSLLGIRPLVGAVFDEGDELTRPNAIVLSEGFWRERFGGDSQALGQVIRLDGEPHTIVGVLPGDGAFPDRRAQAWVPFHVRPADGNYLSMFEAVAKLRPGATAAQAAAEATARGRLAAPTGMTTMAIFGNDGPIAISATTLKDALTADVRQPLLILVAAVLLLFVTAAANVASLQLARATARRREIAIRAALGAGRARIVRQLLCESVLLGGAGGVAGVTVAWLLRRVMPAVLPVDFPRIDDVGLDSRILLVTLLLSVGVSLAFGLLPALRVRRVNLVASLAEDGLAPAGISAGTDVGRTRRAIITAQVAIACVLLIGASLLGRSFLTLLTADRGYDPAGILTARVSLPASAYTAERRYEILRNILDRLASTPQVTDAAFTSELPLTVGGSTSAFTLRRPGGIVNVQASPRIVSPRSFSALGMRILDGRGFSDADGESAPPVVVVNRTFARRYLEDNAIGARLPMGAGYQQDDVEATVIGVVDDVQYLTIAEVTRPELYYSFRQFKGRVPVPVATLLLRTNQDPRMLSSAVRAAVRDADSNLAADGIATMQDRVLSGLARPRLYMILIGTFAGFALLIAGVGLFAVLSQTVAERTREMAIRSALGARPADILRLVVGQGMTIASGGLVVGIVTAALLARLISTLLYGVTAYDRVTYITAPVLLLIVAAIACFVPARRAVRMNSVMALKGN